MLWLSRKRFVGVVAGLDGREALVEGVPVGVAHPLVPLLAEEVDVGAGGVGPHPGPEVLPRPGGALGSCICWRTA
jgi:hypothetical protein